MSEQSWRTANIQKATAARTLKKHRRWAEEMRAAGWKIEEPVAAK